MNKIDTFRDDDDEPKNKDVPPMFQNFQRVK